MPKPLKQKGRPCGRPFVAHVTTGYSAPTSLPPPVPQT